MKKIALIAINSRSSHSNPTLFALKKILKENEGTEPFHMELTINENWREALEKLIGLDCDYYLFSVYIWNRSYVEKILPLLKTLKPDSKMVLGGPEITYNLDYWKDRDWTDLLVKGQAEDFIPNLLTFDGSIYESAHTPIDEIVFPYEEEDKDSLQGRLVYYESSRGCLFNCSYCLSSCDAMKPEYRHIETVKEELKKLIALKPKIVKMVDRTFNSRMEYAREIWRFLIDERSPVPFHFELHPLFLKDEDFDLLAKAPDGLFFFEVGIQSTDEEVLRAVNRPWNRPKEKENIDRLCAMENVHTHLDQIVALPGDTKDKAVRSFNEIISHGPDDFQLGFLKILPGTPLAEATGRYGLRAASFPPYEVVESKTFPFRDIKSFYRAETDLNRFYNSGYFPGTLLYLMNRFPDPWTFFTELSLYSPENRMSKQWAALGESLMKLTEEKLPEVKHHVVDLLRYDWCPFATGQNYPPFLRLEQDEKIKDLRRESYPLFEEKIDGFSRRDFNRSILFVPMAKDKITLFYRKDGGSAIPVEIPISCL